MSKIVLYPANDYDFDAADVAAYLAGLTSGVFSSAEDFPVTAAGGLKVTVGAGRGWVHPSRFTGYSITKRESDTLTMPLADPSLPRIDRIVMRYDAGARAASLQVLQGTASSTPTAPAISRTELIYDLCLAEIARPAGSTSITTGQIADTRLDEALCGIVRDGVTGIPTDELLAAAKERINALEEKATNSAAAAKDSEDAAALSETHAAASEKNAKTSETAAKQALQDTETEHTAALQNIAQARTAALTDVANSTRTATTAAETATQQATAAAGSASTATTKAGEASTSAGAAFNSCQAAEKAQKAAENAAELAGTRAGTDKTLSVDGAPADAKTVGDKFKSIKTDWNSVTDKPSTFPPSAHTHSYAGSASAGGDATRALGVKDYAGSRTIEIGYATAGLTTSNLTHIAGYTDNGTKIKGVSKDVLKSWLGVIDPYPVGSIYTSTSSTSPASLFGGTWVSLASEHALMGVSSSHGAGSTVSAGLPNITGETTAMTTRRFVTPSGAFATASSQPGPDGYANNLGLNVNFYASRCSSVYGNSSTVQPAAYNVYMWIRTA